MAVAAFFDIDGTLYRDSLMIEHFKKLLKYEVINPNLWYDHVKSTYDTWKKRRGDYEDYMEELADVYLSAIKGLNINEIDFISKQVIELKGDTVYSFTRERIEWHKSQGHLLFFVSGSPDYLVRKMAEKYGATAYKGSTYYMDENNNLTGEVFPMWDSDHKQEAILKIVKDYDIDLDESYAYGDTNGDFTMLGLAGHGYAINPTKELIVNLRNSSLHKNSVKVIIERKDVIYELSPDVTLFNE